MIPFPGESLAISQAAADADTSLGVDVMRRGSESGATAGHRALSAGEQWRAWVTQGTATYLESPTEDAVVSWVVEVLSGTATLTAGEAYDTSFFGDNTLAPSVSLGTHTVTGPTTLVIPSTFTVAQVYDDPGDKNYLMLHLAATSGSADVQQVKMRVWPPDGPLGGWSDVKPAWDTTQQTPEVRTHPLNVSATAYDASNQGAWDAAVTGWHADLDTKSTSTSRTFSTASAAGNYDVSQQEVAQTSDYRAQMSASPLLVMLTGADGATRSPINEAVYVGGVDWIRPPNEVRQDVTVYAQTEGAWSTQWANAHVSFGVATGGVGPVAGGPSVHSQGGEWAPTASGVWTVAATHTTEATSPAPLDAAPGDRRVLVTLSHSAALGDADAWPGWSPGAIGATLQDVVSYSFEDVRTFVHMPPYRVWSPSAAPTPKPHLIFQRSDGLGAGAALVYKRDTRQSSGLVYGNY